MHTWHTIATGIKYLTTLQFLMKNLYFYHLFYFLALFLFIRTLSCILLVNMLLQGSPFIISYVTITILVSYCNSINNDIYFSSTIL